MAGRRYIIIFAVLFFFDSGASMKEIGKFTYLGKRKNEAAYQT